MPLVTCPLGHVPAREVSSQVVKERLLPPERRARNSCCHLKENNYIMLVTLHNRYIFVKKIFARVSQLCHSRQALLRNLLHNNCRHGAGKWLT